MVTRPSYYAGSTYFGAETFFGLSTDSKPTDCGNGSAFIEMDASAIYFFDAASGDWLEWGAEAAAEEEPKSAATEEKQKAGGKNDADDPAGLD